MDSNERQLVPLIKPNTNSTHISILYPEILALIFTYLDLRDKGRACQVCTKWRDAAYRRSVWRRVEAKLHLRRGNPSLFPSLIRRGIRRVQVLSVRRNIKDLVHGITDLEHLSLSGCYNIRDDGLSQAFVNPIPSLTVLNLSLCKQITDASLRRISEFVPNLEVLELGGCGNVTNDGLLLLSRGLFRLLSLNLRSCRHISDVGIAHLSGLDTTGTRVLENLSLQDCQKLTDESLRHISSGLSHLKSLNLSFCGSITDSGLRYISKIGALRELNLRSCDNITDSGIAHLAEGGSRINSLDVSFCDKMGDQALIYVSQGLFGLRCLSLNACQVSDEGLARIGRALADLHTLNIGQCNRVTDRGLSEIADHLANLRCIDLYGCTKITTVGLERIMGLPQLRVLNLGLWHKK